MAAVRVLGADDRTTETVVIRGRPQTLRLYGSRGSGDPVIVSSGDGGWIHLGPAVAQTLAAKGFFVVGFDAKAYLEGFTSGSTALRLEDEPGDYRTLADYAARGVLEETDPDRRVGGRGPLGARRDRCEDESKASPESSRSGCPR